MWHVYLVLDIALNALIFIFNNIRNRQFSVGVINIIAATIDAEG